MVSLRIKSLLEKWSQGIIYLHKYRCGSSQYIYRVELCMFLVRFQIRELCIKVEIYLSHWRREKSYRHLADGIFKCLFLNENLRISEDCSQDSKTSIGSDNDFAPNRRQAIIWINDGLVYWHVYICSRPQWVKGDGEVWQNTKFVSFCWHHLCITMTSQWAWWRLKSPASRLFTHLFIQAQMKENIKAPRQYHLWWEFTEDRWIPRTKDQ